MVTVNKLVGVIAVASVVCRVEVYELAALYNELTSGLCILVLINIENVVHIRISSSGFEFTAVNVNYTSRFAENNVSVRSRVEVTVFNGKFRINAAGDNGICSGFVCSAADHYAVTCDSNVRTIVNVENLNNTVRFPICLDGLAVKVDCYSLANDLDCACEINVACEHNVVTVCKSRSEDCLIACFNGCFGSNCTVIIVVTICALMCKCQMSVMNSIFAGLCIIVSCCRNCFLLCKCFFTYRALNAICETVFCTCSSLSGNGFFGMTEFFTICCSANCTSLWSCTSCGVPLMRWAKVRTAALSVTNVILIFIYVVKSTNFFCLCVTTSRTGISLNACGCASRFFRYNSAIPIMAESINRIRCVRIITL